MRINSKNKGSAFEREIAHLLTEIFKKDFSRTPGSGAFTGGKNRVRTAGLSDAATTTLTGDLIIPTGFPFSIECKSYAKMPWHQIMHGECKQLDGWLKQAIEDANSINLTQLIIIKINHNGMFFVIPSNAQHLLSFDDQNFPHLEYKDHRIYSMLYFTQVLDVKSIKTHLPS